MFGLREWVDEGYLPPMTDHSTPMPNKRSHKAARVGGPPPDMQSCWGSSVRCGGKGWAGCGDAALCDFVTAMLSLLLLLCLC